MCKHDNNNILSARNSGIRMPQLMTANLEFIDEAPGVFAPPSSSCELVTQSVNFDGVSYKVRAYEPDSFIISIDDPFWISTSDHVYLNASYVYGAGMRKWIVERIGAQSDTHIVLVPIPFAGLTRMGLDVSDQVHKFQLGHPIWRQSALSCDPRPGEKAVESAMSDRLRDALHAWIPIAEFIARHAIQLGRHSDRSQFVSMSKGDCTSLAETVIGRALGYEKDVETETPKPRSLRVKEIGIEDLKVSMAAYRYRTAYREAQETYFKD
jgi:hypothetical protein